MRRTMIVGLSTLGLVLGLSGTSLAAKAPSYPAYDAPDPEQACLDIVGGSALIDMYDLTGAPEGVVGWNVYGDIELRAPSCPRARYTVTVLAAPGTPATSTVLAQEVFVGDGVWRSQSFEWLNRLGIRPTTVYVTSSRGNNIFDTGSTDDLREPCPQPPVGAPDPCTVGRQFR